MGLDVRQEDRAHSRIVVALGVEASQSAAIYAELTGRVAGPVCSSPLEIDATATALVVTTTEHVGTDLLEALFPRGTQYGSAPGIIFARSPAQLRSRVRAVAAKFLDSDSSSGPIIELLADTALDDVPIGRRRLIGGHAARQVIRDTVTSPSSLLCIVTGGAGFDLNLGNGLSLCDSILEKGRSTVGAPCCRLTGECFRILAPIPEAAAVGRIVSADEIRSRILVICACKGILSADENRRWGYVDATMDSRHVAAIVTAWGEVVLQPLELEHLLGQLYRGATVGRAVAEMNRRNGNFRLAVLGDPDSHIDPLPPEELAQLRYREPPAPLPGDGGRFLHALTYATEVATTGEVQRLAAIAARQVRAFEHIAGLGMSTSESHGVGEAMRHAVLKSIACDSILAVQQHWTPLATGRRHHGNDRCETCGDLLDVFRFDFRSSGIPSRELLTCRRCETWRDAKIGSRLRLVESDRTLTLAGELPIRDWSAVVQLGCQAKKLSRVFAWPADATGAPARSCAPPTPWPPGTLTIAVIILAGTELSIVTTPATGDTV